MNRVIPLQHQIEAKHPDSGKPITIVGIETTNSEPRLVVLHRGPRGIYAETVEYAQEMPQ